VNDPATFPFTPATVHDAVALSLNQA
jgi:hypothetical protein